jgi:hypothetical protein
MPLKTLGPIGPRAVGERVKKPKKPLIKKWKIKNGPNKRIMAWFFVYLLYHRERILETSTLSCMKKRRKSPNLPQDEGARPDYFGCSQNGGTRTHFMGARPHYFGCSPRTNKHPSTFQSSPPLLPSISWSPLLPHTQANGGTTPPSPKPRLRKHTWGMMASVCGLWPQCGQLETTQATTLKSGSGRTSLQFLNLPGWGENCIGKFSRHTPLHTPGAW